MRKYKMFNAKHWMLYKKIQTEVIYTQLIFLWWKYSFFVATINYINSLSYINVNYIDLRQQDSNWLKSSHIHSILDSSLQLFRVHQNSSILTKLLHTPHILLLACLVTTTQRTVLTVRMPERWSVPMPVSMLSAVLVLEFLRLPCVTW